MDKRTLLIIALIIIGGTLAFYFFGNCQFCYVKDAELANPASKYCEEQGGELKMLDFEKGEKGFCIFSDNTKCEEWDFYGGACNKGQLLIEDLVEGSGPRADEGDSIIVRYTGRFMDNLEVFDSSVDRDLPFSFTIGANEVIPGWEQGLLGMKVGGKRILTLAPELAYGEIGVPGAIPANSTLIFEIELLEIQDF